MITEAKAGEKALFMKARHAMVAVVMMKSSQVLAVVAVMASDMFMKTLNLMGSFSRPKRRHL